MDITIPQNADFLMSFIEDGTPSLTSVTFKIGQIGGSPVFSKSFSSTGSGTWEVNLTQGEIASIPAGRYKYQIDTVDPDAGTRVLPDLTANVINELPNCFIVQTIN